MDNAITDKDLTKLSLANLGAGTAMAWALCVGAYVAAEARNDDAALRVAYKHLEEITNNALECGYSSCALERIDALLFEAAQA